MKRILNKKALLMTFMVIMFFCVSVSVYALFVQYYKLQQTVITSDVELTISNETFDRSEFVNTADVISKDITVTNISTVYANYKLVFEISSESYFADALLLIVDQKVIGNLGVLCGEEGRFELSMPYPLYTENNLNSRTHKISLEYHIGSSSFYNDYDLDLDISVIGVSLNAKNYIYVSNEDQLKETLANTKAKHTNIILLDNITLNSPLVAKRMANIDLNGFNINGTINFNCLDYTTTYIYSSRGNASITNVLLNNPNAIILTNQNIIVNSFNASLLASLLSTELDNTLFPYLTNDLTLDSVYNNYLSYIDYTFNSNLVAVNNNTFNVTNDIVTRKVDLLVTINNDVTFNKRLTVLGADENEIYKLFDENLFALEYTTEEQVIYTNLFLPQILRNRTATIEWFSNDPSILSSDGIINYLGFDDKEVKLSAIITINNNRYFQDFNLIVKPSLIKIKNYFEYLNQTLNFYQLGDFNEIIVDLDCIRDIQFSNIINDTSDPSILNPDIDTYFSIEEQSNNYKISFSKLLETGSLKGLLPYTITLDDGRVINGNLNILAVSKLENVDPFKVAYDYFITVYDTIMELRNQPLDKLDLISAVDDEELSGLDISYRYQITNGTHTISGETYINPDNVTDMIEIISNNDTYEVYLNPYEFPRENTIVYIDLEITFGQTTQNYAIPFELKGILHNSSDDIEDFVLYYELLQLYGRSYNVNINGVEDFTEDKFIFTDDVISNQAINTLNINSKGIKSIKGLEYFVNLKKVYLYGNQISDLSPLATMNWLEELNLGFNNIVDLSPLADLYNLKKLNLNYNFNIVDISHLEHLVNLDELCLNETAIVDLSVLLKLTSLYTLYLRTDNFSNNAHATFVDNENYVITALIRTEEKYGSSNYFFGSPTVSTKYAPTNDAKLFCKVLNSIVPSLQFGSVLYLPYNIVYTANSETYNYAIAWRTNFDDIVQIDNISKNTVIIQPITLTNLKLYATINISGKGSLTRVFDVSALQASLDNSGIINIDGNDYDAKVIIPDDNLRNHIFKIYDPQKTGKLIVSGSGIYTVTDGSGNSFKPADLILDLSNKNIKDITGLKYFNDLNALYLTYNSITDYSELEFFTKLNRLNLNGYLDPRQIHDALINLNLLNELNLIGVTNINTEEMKEALRRIKLNRGSVKLYTTSTTTVYDPFEEILQRALSIQKSYYVVYKGITPIDLDLTVLNDYTIESIIGITTPEVYNFASTYAYNTGYYEFNNNMLSYSSNKTNVVDDYGLLNLTMRFNMPGVSSSLTQTRQIVVVSMAPIIKVNGVDLETLIPNESIRKALLEYCDSNNAFTQVRLNEFSISLSTIQNIETLTGISVFDGNGLRGIELFTGLRNLTINGYRNLIGQENYGLNLLKNLTLLESLTFDGELVDNSKKLYAQSIIHTTELINFPSEFYNGLTKLAFKNCAVITFGEGTDNFLQHFTSLRELYILNSNVLSFSFLQGATLNHQISTIHTYDNPASMDKLSEYFMGVAYNAMDSQFKGKNESGQFKYAYYMYSNTVIYTEGIIGELEVTLSTETYSASNSSYIFESNAYVNVIDVSKTKRFVYLPTKTTKEFPVTWSSSPQNGNVISFDTSSEYEWVMIINSTNYKYAYITIEASVNERDEKFYYYFLLYNPNGTQPANTMNISAFISNGKIVDPHFMNISLKAISNSRINGIFVNQATSGVVSFDTLYSMDIGYLGAVAIHSIKGISAFTYLAELTASTLGIVDISDIKECYNIRYLNFYDNAIVNLCDETGESYFINHTNLYYLNLNYNHALSDLRPIVFSNINNTITRTGLENIRYLNVIFSMHSIFLPRTNYAYEMYKALSDTITVSGDFKIYAHRNMWGDGATEINTKTMLDEYVDLFYVAKNAIIQVNSSTGTLPTTLTYDGQTINISSYKAAAWDSNNFTIDGYTYEFTDVRMACEYDMVVIAYPQWAYSEKAPMAVTLRFSPSRGPNRTPDEYPSLFAKGILNKYIIQINGEYFDADTIFECGLFKNAVFNVFDLVVNGSRDWIITDEERKATCEELFLREKGIESIKGIEYFTKITFVNLAYAYITYVPQLRIPTETYESFSFSKLSFENCRLLTDLSGLVGSGVKELTLTYALGIDSNDMRIIKDLDLDEIFLQEVKIADYSFLEGFQGEFRYSYYNSRREPSGGLYTIGNNFQSLPSNKYYIRNYVLGGVTGRTYKYRVFLDNVGELISTVNSNTRAVPTNMLSDEIFGAFFITNRLDLEAGYSTGSELPSSVSIQDTTYQLSYDAFQNSGKYTLSGTNNRTLTIDPSYEGLEIQVLLYVISPVSANKKSYAEIITLIVGTEGEVVEGYTLPTDGTIQITSEDYNYYNLTSQQATSIGGGLYTTLASNIIKDEMLRLYFFDLIDKDSDGIITRSEISYYNTNELLLNNNQRIITDFSGIELLKGITKLTVTNFNTRNLEPITKLTSLTNLTLNPLNTKLSETPTMVPIFFYDLSKLSDLTLLTTLNISNMNFVDVNFLKEMPQLTSLTITNNSRLYQIAHIRTTLGYSVLINNLSLSSAYSSNNSITENEKLAGFILDNYILDVNNPKTEIYYDGKTYEVSFESLSHCIEINDQSQFTITPYDRSWGGVVCKIVVNGVTYEKYFIVNFN